ncbi:MAG: transcription termination factor NusA [Phycisphaerae bacterium]
MNQELIRTVDAIAKERNIDREIVFADLEMAMVSAVKKSFGTTDEVKIQIDRGTGEIVAFRGGEQISLRDLGRIPAQTAKQVMIQKIREAERDSVYDEYLERRGSIVSGQVTRIDPGAVTVNLGRAEAFLPVSEQIPGETYQLKQRLRAMVLEVREGASRMGHSGIKIVLSRTSKDFIKKLFELEVPEVSEGIIQIKALSREAGYRSKVAVVSADSKVDAVGACVGVRGSRIKSIVDELNGEKIDIVRWNDSSTVLIGNALKPAEVNQIALCFELGRATVVVDEEQLSLAIGKRGQNVRLAARLTGWDIDIITPAEYNVGIERLERIIKQSELPDQTMLNKMVALGMVSVTDVAEVGSAPLMSELGFSESQAPLFVKACMEEGERIQSEIEQAKAQAQRLALTEAEGQTDGKVSGAMRVRFSARVAGEQEADGAAAPETPVE